MGYRDHSVNDLEKYRSKKSTAFKLGITAIVTGCLIIIGAFIIIIIYKIFLPISYNASR